MNLAPTHVLPRIVTWLRALRGAACARTLLSAILLLACGADLGLPWVSFVIETNQVCPCCHRKGAACCRRMHHEGRSWQGRSCGGANCSSTRGTLSANALWATPRQFPFYILPSGAPRSLAQHDFPARLHGFSLRQRPPPSHWS
jgi:hypothetical protein